MHRWSGVAQWWSGVAQYIGSFGNNAWVGHSGYSAIMGGDCMVGISLFGHLFSRGGGWTSFQRAGSRKNRRGFSMHGM